MSNASEHFISESSAITTFAVALPKRSCVSLAPCCSAIPLLRLVTCAHLRSKKVIKQGVTSKLIGAINRHSPAMLKARLVYVCSNLLIPGLFHSVPNTIKQDVHPPGSFDPLWITPNLLHQLARVESRALRLDLLKKLIHLRIEKASLRASISSLLKPSTALNSSRLSTKCQEFCALAAAKAAQSYLSYVFSRTACSLHVLAFLLCSWPFCLSLLISAAAAAAALGNLSSGET